MESFSSTATWMILLRVAALSSRLPVQPRMSTAMPMAIVLCLKGRRWVIRPRANRTRRKWNQTGQTALHHLPLSSWDTLAAHTVRLLIATERPPPSEYRRASVGILWRIKKDRYPRTWSVQPWSKGHERAFLCWSCSEMHVLLVPLTMTGLRRCQVPNTLRSLFLREVPKPPGLGDGMDRKMR